MHDIGTPQILDVLVTALAGFVIGGLWYGPLFSKPWMKASGVTPGKHDDRAVGAPVRFSLRGQRDHRLRPGNADWATTVHCTAACIRASS